MYSYDFEQSSSFQSSSQQKPHIKWGFCKNFYERIIDSRRYPSSWLLPYLSLLLIAPIGARGFLSSVCLPVIKGESNQISP